MRNKLLSTGSCTRGHLLGFLTLLIFTLLTVANTSSIAEVISFDNNWGEAGVNLLEQNAYGIEIVYSVPVMELSDLSVNGEAMQNVIIPGVILPRDAGTPNLPEQGRYLAVPEGATAMLEIIDYRTEVFHGVNLAPAFEIPRGDYDGPLVYKKNPDIYNSNTNYPAEPVVISEISQMRGIDVVILGITPFQYNPVSRDLTVYKDIRVRVNFTGGGSQFGEDRLRSRLWEPVLEQQLLNYSSLPEVDFNLINLADEDNVEYIIIVPDEPEFIAWADTIKSWRNQQGIITGITTLSEIGGNDAGLIESYIDNAYHTWEIPPAAVLILSDYQGTGDHYGITAPVASGVISDNKYADIDGDNLPDLIIGRICAQTEEHLATMIGKMLSYEREPYTDPDFYNQPLIAGGWQSDRWFILCTEIIYGYMFNELDKRPVRQYSGTTNPPTNWSTNGNTYMVVDYFGPRGLQYIPDSPSYLTNWSGSAAGVNAAINSGAFIVQHRDHGSPTSWGDPSYSVTNVNQLTNTMYPYVFSINCSSGKYNNSSPCLAEAFHRSQYGAIGVNAASGTSYSFVNDTYVWGMYDSMFPDFDPGYPETGGDPVGGENLRPGVASVNGKYFLEASNWPYNQGSKTITYHLFHHHGDALMTLYSEVPQELTVSHADELVGGVEDFTVTADEGAMIGLSAGGEWIGAAEGTGAPVNIEIIPQVPGSMMKVTVTKFNYYRYMMDVNVMAPAGPHVIAQGVEVADAGGWDPNGQLDYDEVSKLTLTAYNIGVEDIDEVTVSISCEDTMLTILDDTEYYGLVEANSTTTIAEGFEIAADADIPDDHLFHFEVTAVAGVYEWESSFEIYGHAPILVFERLEFSDPTGNNNGWLDPGETADMDVLITNEGSSTGQSIEGMLTSADPWFTVNSALGAYENIDPGVSAGATFNVSADPAAPQEYIAGAILNLSGDHGLVSELDLEVIIGNGLYDPTGPDNYGYLAYDPHDAPELPVYDWVEICADSGGLGTLVDFTLGEQVFIYDLPFTFQYYGVEYDTFSIATNGWIAMGRAGEDDYSNSGIPNSDGPPNMIAGYWEDLSPHRPNSGRVWQYYDETLNRLIVEYNHIEQYAPTGAFETFQIILYDPAHYSTLSGDGRILFQYKEMSATAVYSEGTIGIENVWQNDGLEYFFDGDYDWHAHGIENEFAVMFTTLLTAPEVEVTLTPAGTPIQIPATGGDFDFNIAAANTGDLQVYAEVWCDVTLPDGSVTGPLLGPVNLTLPVGFNNDRDRNQAIPAAAPEGTYEYNAYLGDYPSTVFHEDHFSFEKLTTGDGPLVTGWGNTGESFEDWFALAVDVIQQQSFALQQNYPNPFNPLTTLTFNLAEGGEVSLVIYDLTGREVVRLADGYKSAGSYQAVFDGSDLASGFYFARLRQGNIQDTKKLLLIK